MCNILLLMQFSGIRRAIFEEHFQIMHTRKSLCR